MAFKPIDNEHIRNRIKDNFSSGYLTLISIIQGVAFSVWVTQLGAASEMGAVENAAYYLRVAFSFLSIVFIVYYYSWFVSIVYTAPNLRESIVPLALGAAQVWPMFYFNESTEWWLRTSLFFLFGALGYANTLITVRDYNYAEEFWPALTRLRREMMINVVTMILLIFMGIFIYKYGVNEFPSSVVPLHIIMYILAICMALKTEYWTLKYIYKILELRRNLDS